MSITTTEFGYFRGYKCHLITLTNKNGMTARITNFGGAVVGLDVPDKDGNMADVVLGYDTLQGYIDGNSSHGALVGRYANRIGGATFELDGQTISLNKNDGENCLHGGAEGWQYQVYEAELVDGQTLKLTMVDPDGHMGFPGTVTAIVTYKLTDDNAIDITYEGTTDKPTVLSMTNHAYFSLSGNHAVEGTDMILYVNADTFTPANENLIPTGEMRPVEGTPFDFRTPKAIGQDINQDYDQLVLGNGYDHNWVLNTAGDITKLALSVYSPATGILLEEYTDQPGVQVYTGNFLTGEVAGKHGIKYPMRASVCIETQLFPDSPNRPEWPTTTLRPGETYTHRCIYKFSVK